MAALAGLMTAGQVEAWSFQDFVPQEVTDAVNDGLDINIEINTDKIMDQIQKKSDQMIHYGKKKLGQVAKDVKHQIMDIDDLQPESWNETSSVGVDTDLETDPDFGKTFQQIVTENGFKFETHPVTTSDGYILNVFRITPKDRKPGAKVVFLMHGILDSADCWVMHRPDIAPAFQLVREGYDVWLGNQRGTKHSMAHTTLSTKSKKFWEFSWTEMGDFDAPA